MRSLAVWTRNGREHAGRPMSLFARPGCLPKPLRLAHAVAVGARTVLLVAAKFAAGPVPRLRLAGPSSITNLIVRELVVASGEPGPGVGVTVMLLVVSLVSAVGALLPTTPREGRFAACSDVRLSG